MADIPARDLRDDVSAVLRRVEAGERIRVTVSGRPAAELERRAIPHFAVCALARIDGTSPVDYLPEEPKRETVRALSRRVLQSRPERVKSRLHEPAYRFRRRRAA